MLGWVIRRPGMGRETTETLTGRRETETLGRTIHEYAPREKPCSIEKITQDLQDHSEKFQERSCESC